MNLTVLADLFGSRASEAVLLHLHHYGETYGRAASKDFAVSLDSVQRQLDRFERTGVMVCRRQGRTLVYTWNPKSRVSKRVRRTPKSGHGRAKLSYGGEVWEEIVGH
jgi:hypothetical protein